MKIWWQSSTPIHRLDDYRTALSAHLESVKRPETHVHINGVDDGSMDLHYNAVVAITGEARDLPSGTRAHEASAAGAESAGGSRAGRCSDLPAEAQTVLVRSIYERSAARPFRSCRFSAKVRA